MRVALFLLLALLLSGCSREEADKDTLFQVSTINALLRGVYDGKMTLGELSGKGDTGIGTYNALDGEMVFIEDVFYRVSADGSVREVDHSAKSPFAAVTWFQADRVVHLANIEDYRELRTLLDKAIPAENIFYAFKITGTFSYIRTRSVPPQQRPYPPLAEIASEQPVFTFRDIRGSLIGFRAPAYVNGLTVAGYHLHFIDESRTRGGHLLECSIKSAIAEIDDTYSFELRLPDTDAFLNAEIGSARPNEIEMVEK